MTKRPEKSEEILLTCKVCMKEIPKSVAKSLEGHDYVYYFCGSDCFSKWQKKNNSAKSN